MRRLIKLEKDLLRVRSQQPGASGNNRNKLEQQENDIVKEIHQLNILDQIREIQKQYRRYDE